MTKILNRATAKAAAAWWANRLKHGDKLKFSAHIETFVFERLQAGKTAFLENDYDPQGPLLDAVRAAGVECRGFLFSGDGILPRKHSTEIKPGLIEPKEGYGNWTTPIQVTGDAA